VTGPRVLHLGNVANNGYINAKLQRRVGVPAEAVCDEWHILSQPEWEDAPIEGAEGAYAPLMEIAGRGGWTRPPWVHSPPCWDPEATQESRIGERVELALDGPQIAADYVRVRRGFAPLRDAQGTDLRPIDVVWARAWLNRYRRHFPAARFERYDVVVAYGIHPILLMLGGGGRPYVAFEHGTLREVPFEDAWRGRLLSLAYRRAAKVIITNPDVVGSAQRLGLENYVFVPHPVDEEKYRPGPSELRRQLEGEGWELVLLSPSRHDWDVKGTDRMLRAFAELVRRGHPRALLVLLEWGLELDRSRALIRELGIESNVRWTAPLPKLRLIDAYRAADIVLDQFLIGTFGAVAPEAMACGRPVVMAFQPEIHEWCFPELPPVVDAREPEQIYQALERLAGDEEERARLGRSAREWVERHHGWRLVVERHLSIYEEILGVRADDARVQLSAPPLTLS
jgi:glycosyltransferase involved in cell wall biosynthesis